MLKGHGNEHQPLRVGAIASSDETTVKIYGYGVNTGSHIPTEEDIASADEHDAEILRIMHECRLLNPKIRLDGGGFIWGFQCWWASEESIKARIGDRAVVVISR